MRAIRAEPYSGKEKAMATDCRIEMKFARLDRVDTIRAETHDRSYELYDEKSWSEEAALAVEGPRGFCARVAAWAVDEWKDEGDG